jgi:predicted TIM-barrel fold metal-dependent hydrolase
MLARLALDRVVIVQPSFYGTDNRCLLDALDALGKTARGVAVLPEGTAGTVLDDHHRRGVRGLRVNVLSSGPVAPDAVRRQIAATAKLCERNGWHIQMFNSAAAISALACFLRQLPVAVMIDHFGLLDPADPLSEAGRTLRALVAEGRVWVKLSAPYRITQDAFDARVGALARLLAEANPERVVWGSDWPHTPAHAGIQGGASASSEETPYRPIDTRALLAATAYWFPDRRARDALLVENPARLYDFD